MSKFKVAILEDSKELLKDLKYELERTGLVEVVVMATRSDEFLKKVAEKSPDGLLLDIDLQDDAMSGLDVAAKLRLPTLFVSGKLDKNAGGLSDVNVALKEAPVEFLTKPITLDKLNGILPKFIAIARALAKPAEIRLTLQGESSKLFLVKSIVCLCAEKDSGSDSNNKEIHFTDRKPGILVDFSFKGMEGRGFQAEQFLTIHKSFRVNAERFNALVGKAIRVKVMDGNGALVDKELPVSENYLPAIRKRLE
ncbi:MAG: response regulator [Flavobacteriales bacterium]|nr:response regulator [Flavobacteriales bacterium]